MFNIGTYQFSAYSLKQFTLYVGVTEVCLCFMHKIAYNSSNVEQIYPKIDAGICL